MKRAALMALVWVSGSGCVSAIVCESSANCPAGGACIDGFCVLPDDGGTGGGNVTGGGGGVTGGGGGGTGGGGGVVECGGGCMAWQTCQPGGGGTCRDLSVSIDSPLEGAVYGGGASARVIARVTDWDGGAFRGSSIPASAAPSVTAPSQLMRIDAGLFMGDYALAASGGTWRLTAGWPAASASVNVVTQVCSVTCTDWQECLPSADGGTCGDLGLTLTWDAPGEDFKYAPDTNVPLSLSVTRADGGAFTREVPFTVTNGAGGMLMLNAGAWTGIVPSGAVDARRTLFAGWAGGPDSGSRNFLVDATPAALRLVVASDGGAFQRDALIPAILISNEPLADAGVSLGGVAMARTAEGNCPNFMSVPDAAACFQLDFSQPVLNALDGGFGAALSGTDMYGNSGGGDGGVLPVTRLRWQVTLAGGADVRAAPALGADGTLYVGTVASSSTGSIFALVPETGATRTGWPVPVGAVHGLAVADAGPSGDVVFYSAKSTTGALIAGLSSLGAGVNTGNQCNSIGGTTYSGLGLIATGSGVRAVGVLSDLGVGVDGGVAEVGRACAFSPSTGLYINGELTSNLNAPPVPGAAESATNVAIDMTRAYFIGRGGRVFSSTLGGSSWSSPVEARVGNNNSALFTGSALYRNSTNTGWGLALAGGPNLGDLHYYVEGMGFSAVALGGALVGQPVLLPTSGPPAFYLYAGVDNGPTLQRFDRNGVAGAGMSTPALASAAPVLGAGGLGYVVSGNGQLTVFPTVNAPVASWRASLPLVSSVVGGPTLDCVRQSGAGVAGARVGVLYVTSSSGVVTAVIVDSPKLDNAVLAGGRAPWPKYQRTAGNAGNVDPSFPLNPGCQ